MFVLTDQYQQNLALSGSLKYICSVLSNDGSLSISELTACLTLLCKGTLATKVRIALGALGDPDSVTIDGVVKFVELIQRLVGIK